MSEMKPGRELDALIAERVMGYRRLEAYPFREGFPCFVNPSGLEIYPSMIPEYSTSIAAAWEVVNEMQGNKWVFRIQSPYCNVIPGAWEAFFGYKHVNEDTFMEARRAETAPHAICLAALKAVGK